MKKSPSSFFALKEDYGIVVKCTYFLAAFFIM